MTLETCKTRLKIAEKAGDQEEIEFWKARIARKSKHSKYANSVVETPKGKKGGK